MPDNLTRILVPVDGSESSKHAVRYGAFLAEKINVKLALLHVHAFEARELMGLTALSREEIAEVHATTGERVFSVVRDLIAPDITVETKTTIGDPAIEIIAEASKEDLIVMGTRGLSHFKELLMGSVSDKVVRHAPCAVTIVR